MSTRLVITGGQVIDPSQNLNLAGTVVVEDGRIARVVSAGASQQNGIPPEAVRIDASGMVVCPGFIDLHCHLREPGYEYKETIASGTLAAARGGFTTVCAMPNTDPPVDSRAAVEFILRTAREQGKTRVLPIGCISKGRRGQELSEMAELAQAGVVGFSDDGNPVASSGLMRHALSYSRLVDLPIIDHCEDPSLAKGGVIHEGWVSTRLGLKGIPAEAEEIAVARDLALAQLTGGRVHLAHLSTRGSVELVRRAKEKGLAVTAEATPHHLTLTEDWLFGISHLGHRVEDPHLQLYGTNAKVNPPLRTWADAQALIQGLKDGVIDMIATDHAPHATVDKVCEFDAAAFGISGLETALGSLMLLVHAGLLSLETLIARLTVGPSRLLQRSTPGLGTLQAGSVADIAIFDPNREWKVEPERFASKGANTPLAGCILKGKPVAAVVDGHLAYLDDALKVATESRQKEQV